MTTYNAILNHIWRALPFKKY